MIRLYYKKALPIMLYSANTSNMSDKILSIIQFYSPTNHFTIIVALYRDLNYTTGHNYQATQLIKNNVFHTIFQY